MSLYFSVADIRREIEAFSGLARDFLAPGTYGVLRQAEADLVAITRRTGGPFTWQIARHNPARTIPSSGSYMPDQQGGLLVYGEMTFNWQIEPVRPSGDTRPARRVCLSGLASTAVRILDGGWNSPDDAELAMWRMEVADDAAPGSHFHVQILGRDDDEVFPKALDVPRLPSVLVSPFACMEFLIAELFQDEWSRHAVQDSGSCRLWRTVQAYRLNQQLQWHQARIAEASGSPWVAWKRAKPPAEIFEL